MSTHAPTPSGLGEDMTGSAPAGTILVPAKPVLHSRSLHALVNLNGSES